MPTAATFDHFLRQLKEQLVDHPYEDEIIKLAFEQHSDDLDDFEQLSDDLDDADVA